MPAPPPAATPPVPAAPLPALSGRQRLTAGLLALLQFIVILDFMIMSPLGAMIMPALSISPRQFGLLVSAYAFSAGASGLLTAGFADRFDRKKLLLFFQAGFLGGTLWCGLAGSFEALLVARVVAGLFGGVIGSIVLAIATDLFPPAMRGRVMGLLQTGFAAAQVLGLPVGLYLANHWHWQGPFLALVLLGLATVGLIVWQLPAVAGHLGQPQERSPWAHLWHTLAQPRHLQAFAATALLTTGGFMLMPFASAFSVHNLGIGLDQLPLVYLATGLSTLAVAPMVGRLADRHGKWPVFVCGSVITVSMVLLYTHLGPVHLWQLMAINVVLFAGIFSRMIPWQATVAGIPAPVQRGAFSALNASTQQLSGGMAALVSGHLVQSAADGRLLHFDRVGWAVVASTLAAGTLVWRLTRAG